MKTLDEVIKALEEYGEFVAECNYCNAEYCGETYEMGKCYSGDALHYLKKYRDHMKNEIIELQQEVKKQKEMIEFLEKPLTWQELQAMEGKPVWVVPEAEKGYWFVIEFFNNNPYYGGDRVCFTNDVMLNRSDLGKTWQAYRKERS